MNCANIWWLLSRNGEGPNRMTSTPRAGLFEDLVVDTMTDGADDFGAYARVGSTSAI